MALKNENKELQERLPERKVQATEKIVIVEGYLTEEISEIVL